MERWAMFTVVIAWLVTGALEQEPSLRFIVTRILRELTELAELGGVVVDRDQVPVEEEAPA